MKIFIKYKRISSSVFNYQLVESIKNNCDKTFLFRKKGE